MNCPKCNRILYVTKTTKLSTVKILREHLCLGCEEIFESTQFLEEKPLKVSGWTLNLAIERTKRGRKG